MRIPLPLLLSPLLMVACSQHQDSNATPAPIAVSAPIHMEHESLDHLMDLGAGIYSGAMPVGEDAFTALAELGVKTVVSVDSARPATELAEAAGLRYVHIPIGYDQIHEEAALALERVMREATDPVYFHCHHGKHRGPAAAALALRAATLCDAEHASLILSEAGTSKGYPGLWRDVEGWQPAAAGAEWPELVEVAQVEGFTAGMADLDRTWDHIKWMRKAEWQTPEEHPDLVLATEASVLARLLDECAAVLPGETGNEPDFQGWMKDSVDASAQLRDAVDAGEVGRYEELYRAVATSCKDCHRKYRNE